MLTFPSLPKVASSAPEGVNRAIAHRLNVPFDVNPPSRMLPADPITTALAPWYFLPNPTKLMPSLLNVLSTTPWMP